MPAKGRPRLTPEDLELRIADYCRRYKATRGPNGLPVFPTGQRETRQHREWIALYKTHNRLGRRSRGQCERCSEPAAEGSIFCETHRGRNAGTVGLSPGERRDLLARQDGRCPVCDRRLATSEGVELDLSEPARGLRALVHEPCRSLAAGALTLGPAGLVRLRELLWPGHGGRARARERA